MYDGSRESSIKETRISRGESLGRIIRPKTSTKFCREDRMSVTSGSMLTCDGSDEEGHFIFLKNSSIYAAAILGLLHLLECKTLPFLTWGR
jgi:hypothetical protein